MLTARQALEMATIGGAQVLGRSDIGAIESGKCADFIAIDLNRIDFAGARHDPVAATVFCHPINVDYNYVHGRPIVSEGQLTVVDIDALVAEHNEAARELVNRSSS